METNFKVTIGVPIYKVEDYLVQCIESAINQDYQNLEILLVDDCSPDSSGFIADTYAKRDPRIRVIHHDKNMSLADVRNTIIKEMTGDAVYWLDSDDYILPNAVSVCVETMQDTGADIVKCAIAPGDEKWVGKYDRDQGLRLMIPEKVHAHVIGGLFKRSVYDGVVHDVTRNLEDYDTILAMVENANKIVVIPSDWYVYRDMRVDSITHRQRDRFSGYELRAYMFNKRYEAYKESYPVECKQVLMKFADFACMAVIFADETQNLTSVRAMMYRRERDVMICDQISAYKKWLYRQIVNRSVFAVVAGNMHKLKHNIVMPGK